MAGNNRANADLVAGGREFKPLGGVGGGGPRRRLSRRWLPHGACTKRLPVQSDLQAAARRQAARHEKLERALRLVGDAILELLFNLQLLPVDPGSSMGDNGGAARADLR